MNSPLASARAEKPTSVAIVTPQRLRTSLLAAALVGLCLFVFGRTVTYQFVDWDDPLHLQGNPLLNPPSSENIWKVWQAPYQGLYAPLTYTFWAGLAIVSQAARPEAGPFQPAVFHAADVVLHTLNALLVWSLLAKLLRRAQVSEGQVSWCSWFGAALFAVHPLTVESVAWVSEARGLLANLFLTAAITCYFCFVERRSPAAADGIATAAPTGLPQVAWLYYAAALVLAAAAMTSKPSAVVAPLLIGIVDWGWYRRPLRAVVAPLLPMFVLAVYFAWLGRSVQAVPDSLRSLSIAARLVVAGDAVAFYLRKFVCPLPLGIDYGRTPQTVLSSNWAYLAVPMVAVLIVILYLTPHRRRWLTALGWFCAALLPVLGLASFQFQHVSTTADRYVYGALPGAALAAAYGMHLLTRYAAPGVVISGGAALVVACGLVSIEACRPWRNNFQLKSQALRANPTSVVGLQGLGLYWSKQREIAKSIEYFERAATLHPDHPGLRELLAIAYLRAGRLPEALEQAQRAAAQDANAGIVAARALLRLNRPEEALAAATTILRSNPDSIEAADAIDTAELLLGRIVDDPERLQAIAERHARGALESLEWKDRAGYQFDLAAAERAAPEAAVVVYCRARGEDLSNGPAAALPLYERAVVADAKAEYLLRLANAYRAVRRIDDAIATYGRVLAADPRSASAHNNLGALLAATAPAAARRHYETALEIDPSFADALSNLGNLAAREGNWPAAAEYYRRALELNPDLTAARQNLAIAESRATGRDQVVK